MALKNYGVLKGTAIQSKMGKGKTPHYQVHLQGEAEVDYRIAINVKSQSYPSEVLYLRVTIFGQRRFIFYRRYHLVLQK